MAISFEMSCAMCGKPLEAKVNTFKFDGDTSVKNVVEATGWIAQQNGECFDIYCSKQCAK